MDGRKNGWLIPGLSLLNAEMFVRNAGYLFAKTIHCPFLFVKAKLDTFVNSLAVTNGAR